MGAQHIKQL